MKTQFRHFALAFVLLSAGFVAGILYQGQGAVHAEIRKGPQREAFQSGSERNEVQLKEIASTLLRIEKKVSEIERNLGDTKSAKK